ncbi:hypothetical protein AB0I22_09830 [Streptomyces sp. NPDC050610]
MITQVVLPGLAESPAQQAPARGTATGAPSGPRPRTDGSQRLNG